MKQPGPYVCTGSGGRVELLNPDPAQIRLRDIALALAKQCRYAGQTPGFYSVAEHSVLVSRALPPALALDGLLHDAAEAYTGDIVSPVKANCIGIKLMEHALDAAIRVALGLGVVGEPFATQVREAVRAADLAVGALECAVFGLGISPGRESAPAAGLTIRLLEWPQAYVLFVAEYEQLRYTNNVNK